MTDTPNASHPCKLTQVSDMLKSASDHNRWQQHAEAERLCRDALDIVKSEFGERNRVYGLALADLGHILQSQDRMFEARDAYTKALDSLEGECGNQDPDALWIFAHLHSLYR